MHAPHSLFIKMDATRATRKRQAKASESPLVPCGCTYIISSSPSRLADRAAPNMFLMPDLFVTTTDTFAVDLLRLYQPSPNNWFQITSSTQNGKPLYAHGGSSYHTEVCSRAVLLFIFTMTDTLAADFL